MKEDLRSRESEKSSLIIAASEKTQLKDLNRRNNQRYNLKKKKLTEKKKFNIVF